MTNTRTFNDNSHLFKRRKRRITNDESQQACQHRLLLQLLVLLLLLCFVLGVLLSQHYFPMDVSTDIFPTRSFQWVFLEYVLESGVF